MKKLKEIYKKVYELKVNRDFEDNTLDDLFEEFMLLLSGYVGLAATFINGGYIEVKDIADINNLKTKIDSLDSGLKCRKDYLLLKGNINLLYELAQELDSEVKGSRKHR